MGESYSLKKITTFLDGENISYQINRHQFETYSTGCRIIFPNTDIFLSAQTNPVMAENSFVQTAIFNSEGILYLPSQGYEYGVINHLEIEDFINHIREVKDVFVGRNSYDLPDCELREVYDQGQFGRRRRPNPVINQIPSPT